MSTIWFSEMTHGANLNTAFSALGDSTRRAIVERLMHGEAPLSELAEPFDMSQTAVSKHVNILKDAGLIAIEKRGRIRHCRLRPDGLEDVVEWIGDYKAFWQRQFSQLYQALQEDN